MEKISLQIPSQQAVERLVRRIVRQMAKNPKVLAVYLFGSHARGIAGLGSDIDLCVIAERLTERELTDVTAYSGKAIDVVLFDELPLDIQHGVFKHGKPLFVRSKTRLERLRHATLREVLDFSPVRERRFEKLLASI